MNLQRFAKLFTVRVGSIASTQTISLQLILRGVVVQEMDYKIYAQGSILTHALLEFFSLKTC